MDQSSNQNYLTDAAPVSVALTDEEQADLEAKQRAIDDEIIELAKTRFQLCADAELDIRQKALEDLNFRAGDQWPDNVEQDRNRDGRPCLVINKLPHTIQQVTNDQRQNRPCIKIHPNDDLADEETAKVIQGLIRSIEYRSNAEAAYDTGFEAAATGGFGYWRVVTDFVDPESFDQEILIKRIRNQFSVSLDPYAEEPDRSDANYGFIYDDLSKEEFEAAYPDARLSSEGLDWKTLGSNSAGWIRSDGVRVCEYFYKEMIDKTIHLLSTGETVDDEDLEQHLQSAAAANIKTGVVKSRQTKVPVIRWVKTNGYEILERTDWLGSYIPIIPVFGAELFIDGKLILESVIRHAKDPQRMLNYWKSAETEAIALAPRAPFIVAEGQLEGHEQQWEFANRKNYAYLQYKPTTIAGQAAPPPQRQNAEPAIQAISQASLMAADDIKSTTGVFDASLGQQTQDVSGVAIQRRTGQSSNSTFHFIDNLTRALKHTGVILVDLIPKIYDTARAMHIIGEDGTQKVVKINQTHDDPSTGKKDVLYSMDKGRYGVTVATGPSYASKRQEAAASMMDFTRAVPNIAQNISDLIVKNMDWPGADELADRLKKMLPPALQADPKQQQIPPQVQAQMQQLMQMNSQLTQHLNETTKIIETKRLDLEHRERVEMAKIQADIEINMAKLKTQGSIALLEQQVDAIKHRMELLQSNTPIDAPQDFNPQQADGGNYAGFGHVGGPPTGGESPGQPVETQP